MDTLTLRVCCVQGTVLKGFNSFNPHSSLMRGEGNRVLCTDEEPGTAQLVNVTKRMLTMTRETGFQAQALWLQGLYSFGVE